MAYGQRPELAEAMLGVALRGMAERVAALQL